MNHPQTVLITGILGQDGSYLAHHALQRGHKVIGGIRNEINPKRLWRLAHLGIEDQISFIELDLLKPESIDRAIESTSPDKIFNFAAQSSVGESFQDPISTAEAGGIGALRIYEKARQSKSLIKIFQASSSEIFGDITDSSHSEDSHFNPKTPYGATKLFAHIMAEAYRASYGTHVSTGILFNHESPLRGSNFVTKKITQGLARIHNGSEEVLQLGNLDAKRDWSHARDFVTAIWDLMELNVPENIVLASGALTSVREFVTLAAEALQIEMYWEGSGLTEKGIDRNSSRVIVEVSPSFYRPYDPAQPMADIKKAKDLLNWTPSYALKELIEEMVQFDIRHLCKS